MSRIDDWNKEIAEAAKLPAKPADSSRQMLLPASAYTDENARYFSKAQTVGSIVFMGD